MSKRLDESLGNFGYDGLVIGTFPPADAVQVTVAAGSAVKRGTVLTGVPGEEVSPVSAALEAANAAYIAADDADASGEAAVVSAYVTGRFARNLLITDGSYALTAADEELLRRSGIFIEDALEY